MFYKVKEMRLLADTKNYIVQYEKYKYCSIKDI